MHTWCSIGPVMRPLTLTLVLSRFLGYQLPHGCVYSDFISVTARWCYTTRILAMDDICFICKGRISDPHQMSGTTCFVLTVWRNREGSQPKEGGRTQEASFNVCSVFALWNLGLNCQLQNNYSHWHSSYITLKKPQRHNSICPSFYMAI